MNDHTKDNQTKNTKKKTPRQLAALGAVILLVLMYLVTLIAAFIYPPSFQNLFMLCIFGTIAIPFLLWIYLWLFQRIKQQKKDAGED